MDSIVYTRDNSTAADSHLESRVRAASARLAHEERRDARYRCATAAMAVIGAVVMFAGCSSSASTEASNIRPSSMWASSDASQMSARYLPSQLANAAPESDRYTPPPPTF